MQRELGGGGSAGRARGGIHNGAAVRTGWGLCDGAWGCSGNWSGWEVGMVVVAAFAVDMLNNMAGKRGDTPLMKAAANGNQFMAETWGGRVGG